MSATLSTPTAPIFTEPDEIYFASGAWGSTEARKVLTSTQLARDHRDGLVPKKESAAFDMGHAWDDLLSTRKPFADLFIERPADVDYRTKAGKEWREKNEAAGKRILTADDATALRRMLERMPKDLRDMCTRLPSQQIVRVEMDQGAWTMQAKADLLDLDHDLIIDIKTTSKPLEEWERSAWTYGYPFQAGWYRKAFGYATGERLGFGFVVTETVAPWRTAYFVPTPRWLAKGDALAADAIGLISRCTATGDWSDVRAGRTLDVPGWMQDGDE